MCHTATVWLNIGKKKNSKLQETLKLLAIREHKPLLNRIHLLGIHLSQPWRYYEPQEGHGGLMENTFFRLDKELVQSLKHPTNLPHKFFLGLRENEYVIKQREHKDT